MNLETRDDLDPAVVRALEYIQEKLAENIDVATLAREAGVSRTVLGERFVEAFGDPPMRYCARWRMRTASNMLRDSKQSSANVAYAVGFNSEAAFNRAFKREFGEPPAKWRRRIEGEVSAGPPSTPVDDRIDYCSGHNGARIAFATCGEGFPLVKAPNWMTHLAHDWTSPVYGHWITECSRTRLIRSDMRGFGMSEWDPPEFSFEAMVGDLAAVIDQAGVDRCDLLGISHGAAIAIAYAARHPERVRKLVLLNSFAEGWAVRADPEEISWRKSLMELNRKEWSRRRVALGEMFVTLYFPSATRELIEWHNERLDLLSNQRNIERMLSLAAHIDVRGALARVRAPALVAHSRQDGNAMLAVGRAVADGLANARFLELDSANHVLLAEEPAWPEFTRELRAFLRAA